MSATVGLTALWIGFLAAVAACLVAVLASVGGERPSRAVIARRLLGLSAAALMVSLGALVWAFLTSDFSLVAVADSSRRDAAAPLRVAGVWAGLAGSLLFWATLVSVTGWWTLRRAAAVGAETTRWAARATAVVGLLVGGTTATLVWLASPFARLQLPAIDGGGVTPILDHPSMLVHPPLLYLGEALLVPVFVLGLLGLGATDGRWIARLHRAVLPAWAVLTIALLLGAQWAYVELGWGGFWAWDPVENSGLLPWLATTVLVHATRRNDPSSRQVAMLALVPLLLALAGGVLTRSGATASVHAFAEAPDVGRALGALVAVVTIIVIGLVVVGRRSSRRSSSPSGSAISVSSPDPLRLTERFGLDHDGLLDLQQVLVYGVLIVVAAGTAWPAIAGDGRAIDGSFYTGLAGPLVVLALVLAGLAGDRRVRPLQIAFAVVGIAAAVAVGWTEPVAIALAGAAASTAGSSFGSAFLTARSGSPLSRSLPMHVGHLGFAVLMLGVAGSTAGASVAVGLAPGETVEVSGVTVRLDQLAVVEPRAGVDGVEATVTVSGPTSGDLAPRLDVHRDQGVVLAEADQISGWRQDVQVVMRDADDDRALLQVTVLPLVRLVWLGGLLIAAAAALASVSAMRNRRSTEHGQASDAAPTSEQARSVQVGAP